MRLAGGPESAAPTPAARPPAADVVVAVTAWTDAVHRGGYTAADRLLAALVDDRRIARLLVANPYRSAPVRLARRALGWPEAPLPAGPGGRVQVTPTRLRRHDPAGLQAIARAYRRYDRHLARAATAAGMARPAIITGNPLVAAYAPLAWAGPVTYYAWDDWAAYPPNQRWWPAYEAAYGRIRERGHRVVAVSGVLLERLRPGGAAAVVPNGIDPGEWERPPPPPRWFAALPRPRLVYVGTLDDRLDVEALARTADRFVQGSVVLAGPEVGGAMAPLRDLANVHVVRPLDRAAVVGVLYGADACVMPHRRTPLTEAMCPLKLFEYLAAGRPVVATDLPPVRTIDPAVLRVPEGGDFGAGVARALQRGPTPEADRRAFVVANAWRGRIDDLLAVALAPGGRPG